MLVTYKGSVLTGDTLTKAPLFSVKNKWSASIAALKLSSLGEGLNFLLGVASRSRTFVICKKWRNVSSFLHNLQIPDPFPIYCYIKVTWWHYKHAFRRLNISQISKGSSALQFLFRKDFTQIFKHDKIQRLKHGIYVWNDMKYDLIAPHESIAQFVRTCTRVLSTVVNVRSTLCTRRNRTVLRILFKDM